MAALAETPAAPRDAGKSTLTLNNLKQALKTVSFALQRTTTSPILQCVRIEQMAEGLAVEATNLDLAIRALCAESGGPTAPIITPADKFIDGVKLLTGDSVRLSVKNQKATVTSADARAVLPLMPAASWPQLAFDRKAAQLTADGEGLARALRFALIAVSHEESRYTLNAVLFQGDGAQLKLIATDGHRMLIYTLASGDKVSEMLPADMAKALASLLGDNSGVDFAFTPETIMASIPGDMPVFVSSRRITGSFPAWEKVVPTDRAATVGIDAQRLLRSLERCALLSPERTAAVDFIFSAGELTLSTSDANSGEAEEKLQCAGGPAEPFTIRVCANYVIELLKKLAGDVEIALPVKAESALLFKASPAEGETLNYIVMPLRIS